MNSVDDGCVVSRPGMFIVIRTLVALDSVLLSLSGHTDVESSKFTRLLSRMLISDTRPLILIDSDSAAMSGCVVECLLFCVTSFAWFGRLR